MGVAAGGGCVYWRLLKLQGQLDEFHEFFSFRQDSTYSIVARDPILTGSDVDGIMKVEPTHRGEDSRGTWRVYEFAKNPDDGSAPLVYRFGFREEMLVELEFPVQFVALYPASALKELLQSLGGGEVEREHGSVHSIFDRRLRDQLPDPGTVLASLGRPSERSFRADGSGEEMLYRYRLRTVTTGKKERKRRAYGRFFFDGDGQLTRVDAGLGKHELRFDIPEGGDGEPVSPED